MRRLWRRAPASKMKALQELRDRLDELGSPEACFNKMGESAVHAGSLTPALPNIYMKLIRTRMEILEVTIIYPNYRLMCQAPAALRRAGTQRPASARLLQS